MHYGASMISRSPNRLRLYATIFAAVIGLQSIWLLGAEMTRPTLPFFPTSQAEAKIIATHHAAAAAAAWIGWPRGDLWVDYAMTEDAALLGDIESGITSNAAQGANNEIYSTTEHAAALAPYDSRVWLMLAATNTQPGLQSNKILAQIKMSYYTSPNDIRLMPLRIQIATRSSVTADDELQSFVESEIRTIILHNPNLKHAIALAYRGASPAGRRFLEGKLAELDAKFLAELQAAKP